MLALWMGLIYLCLLDLLMVKEIVVLQVVQAICETIALRNLLLRLVVKLLLVEVLVMFSILINIVVEDFMEMPLRANLLLTRRYLKMRALLRIVMLMMTQQAFLLVPPLIILSRFADPSIFLSPSTLYLCRIFVKISGSHVFGFRLTHKHFLNFFYYIYKQSIQ